ncbi:MAG TPA: molecular chaperone HscC [Xanthobacteraceae bacterium]|nr:molecular chaperone HscC [Xanthobacteraceae bacterium]
MALIGIDLGTTNSAVAVWTDAGPRLIANAIGENLTPSVVGLDDDNSILVGQPARNRLVTHPERTVASFKRWMGTTRETRLGRGHVFRPEELSAFVLKSLKADAQAHLGGDVREAVISVPAYFNDVQRKATLDAAGLAGLKVERLVNEPTAAALAYGLQTRKEGLFLVFDLGGGTFDVSLLDSYEGVMEVRSTAGDTFLGGDDFTRGLAELLAERHRFALDDLARNDLARLLRACEAIKHALSAAQQTEYEIHIGGKAVTGRLDRASFEQAAQPLLARIRAPLERAISDSKKRLADVDAVVLVGGATRMPMIRSLVARLFAQLPLGQVDPDTVVALGAGVQAGLKARDAALEDVVMTDVCPFTLGTGVAQNARTRDETTVVLPIIERNSPVPISRAQTLTTIHDNQRAVRVSVYQGESLRPEGNVLLGEFDVAVPPGPAGKESFEVRFTYDINGALESEVTVKSTGKRERRIFRNASNLPHGELEARFAALAEIKIAPREQAANRALLARAEALYEELLADDRDHLSQLIARFEHDIGQAHEIERVRTEFAAALDKIERLTFRLI